MGREAAAKAAADAGHKGPALRGVEHSGSYSSASLLTARHELGDRLLADLRKQNGYVAKPLADTMD
jgi:hypothetical protein